MQHINMSIKHISKHAYIYLKLYQSLLNSSAQYNFTEACPFFGWDLLTVKAARRSKFNLGTKN